jgi:hypothetical protein
MLKSLGENPGIEGDYGAYGNSPHAHGGITTHPLTFRPAHFPVSVQRVWLLKSWRWPPSLMAS